MNNRYFNPAALIIGFTAMATTSIVAMAAPPVSIFNWLTVVNNGDLMPTDACVADVSKCRTFNSYNQPSVNANKVVVMRARSRGGQGQPVHGVYTRDMAAAGPIVKILDRDTLVPQPNNRESLFVEPPSFPRIDIQSNSIATRGNHQPVWKVIDPVTNETVEQLGTTGIYTNPFGDLITGASKLGSVPEFYFFEVPEVPGTPFDVFPGAPAVTAASTIVFKGNYTVGSIGKTGVYYRDLKNVDINGGPGSGSNPVVLIANNTTTKIPGTTTIFGSTAPPSAANRQAVFAGFDNEDNPTLGGIYLTPLAPYPLNKQPKLTTLVSIGSPVPGETNASFNRLGEGVSFDGRLVSFWGAWGTVTKELTLQCPAEGNKDRIKYCNELYPNGFTAQVPINQGIFVYDTINRKSYRIATTGDDFADFVYWNFSGRAPGVGAGEEGDDGELARWRSSAFMAVSGRGANFHCAFKARTGLIDSATHVYLNPVDGIYLVRGPGQPRMQTVVKTGMAGSLLDSEAIDDLGASLPVTEMGIERDSLRGDSLVINASMGSEETGWAGVYLTRVPRP